MIREVRERGVPMTAERGATALAQAGTSIQRALDEVLLAVEIFRDVDGWEAVPLEDVVARLEEAELYLNQIRGG